MKRFCIGAASSVLLMVLSAAVALPAQAAVDTSSCVTPLLSQPFAAWGDSNWYTLAPGQNANGFTGTGWALSAGAKVTAATLPNGLPGTALDLPGGAIAVSPQMCVTADYPTARTMLEQVSGTGGVSFSVSYAGTASWGSPRTTGLLHASGGAWSATGAVQMQPANVSGWQLVRVVLTGASRSESRLVNLFVDPRMGH